MGLVGMKNLGNTCYMNSVLQCLGNTEPLVRFFLLDIYLTQINEKNTYGSSGKVAIAFANLLKKLYEGTSKSVQPYVIKHEMGLKRIRFQGFRQHDSQEMLSCLLEIMHEDVN